MTDEELIKRLRGRSQFCRDRGEFKSPELLDDAANRIEELVKELAEADARALRYKSERDGQARKISDAQSLDTASFEAEQKIVNQRGEINILQARAETAEAKLAKAVEFIQEVRRNGDTRLAFMAIAVLAELEKTE